MNSQVQLSLIGVTTDGEYCTLRSQGETRPLHLWQLIHDAKESVKKMKKETLLSMLLMVAGKTKTRQILTFQNKNCGVIKVILKLN